MTAQERDAWAFAYRLYEELAPKLRQAATMNDDNETAEKLFMTALERIRPRYIKEGHDVNRIYFRVYDMLDDVFKDAQNRALRRV